jgi:hypothetical protein
VLVTKNLKKKSCVINLSFRLSAYFIPVTLGIHIVSFALHSVVFVLRSVVLVLRSVVIAN